MEKSIKKIFISAILILIVGLSFKYNFSIISVLGLATFTALIFFYNKSTISVGMVKLWCVNIGLSILFVYDNLFKINSSTSLILLALWGVINLFGVYKSANKKSEA